MDKIMERTLQAKGFRYSSRKMVFLWTAKTDNLMERTTLQAKGFRYCSRKTGEHPKIIIKYTMVPRLLNHKNLQFVLWTT